MCTHMYVYITVQMNIIYICVCVYVESRFASEPHRAASVLVHVSPRISTDEPTGSDQVGAHVQVHTRPLLSVLHMLVSLCASDSM